MSRVKPYTSNQVSWQTILQKDIRIPMNQREYSWDSKEIIRSSAYHGLEVTKILVEASDQIK